MGFMFYLFLISAYLEELVLYVNNFSRVRDVKTEVRETHCKICQYKIRPWWSRQYHVRFQRWRCELTSSVNLNQLQRWGRFNLLVKFREVLRDFYSDRPANGVPTPRSRSARYMRNWTGHDRLQKLLHTVEWLRLSHTGSLGFCKRWLMWLKLPVMAGAAWHR